MANGRLIYEYSETQVTCMSGIALIGAALVVMIFNVLPGALSIQLSGQVHLLYVLVSLFAGVVTYQAFKKWKFLVDLSGQLLKYAVSDHEVRV